MNAERLIGSLVRGALGGRRKRGRGALRFLTGGRGSFLNASTLLTAVGVAWGLLESSQSTPATNPSSPMDRPRGTPAPPPPLPVQSPQQSATADVPQEILQLVQLTISAARADGVLSEEEKAHILSEAAKAGVQDIVQREMSMTRPLSEIVAGVTDARRKSDMYTLAFAIVRADESVSGAERVYLAQLAGHLGLDSKETQRLEQSAADRIDQESSA